MRTCRTGGLTDEMRSRNRVRGASDATSNAPSKQSDDEDFNKLRDEFRSRSRDDDEGGDRGEAEPIGLEEIAREQKRDRELFQLKKEEPFVFSTV